MCLWQHNIHLMIDKIDACIQHEKSTAMTPAWKPENIGHSESCVSRKLSVLSDIELCEYVRGRRLAFALRELR